MNFQNKYCQGDNATDHHNEVDKIEWQSLNSYHISCIEDEEIINEGNDNEKQTDTHLECTSDNKLSNESEHEDTGCTDQLLHGQFQQMAALLMQGTEEFIRKVWREGWSLVQHQHLPAWLKDNNFLVRSHRPELNSYKKCFLSIFRVHTETVNIWTHLLGWLGFLAILVVVMSQPIDHLPLQDKLIIMCFFVGTVLCLGFSWLFHTVFCHSQKVGKIFNKLDYCGIAFLTVGSFIPWLYYSFYCRFIPKVVYMTLIVILGTFALIVSMFDKFATPPYRPLRAGIFIGLGLCGAVPCLHYIIVEGFWSGIYQSSVGWLSLMAIIYITGAVIYAARIPERIFPGKFDIIFQSHQIFHVFVVLESFS